jgi:membrane protein
VNLKATWDFVKTVFSEWSEDKASLMAAATSYYTIFALAPLLVLAIGIAAIIFDRASVQQQVLAQFQGLVGQTGSDLLGTMLENADKLSQSSGIVATVIAIVTLLLGAAGLFGQLKEALNVMWEVEPRPGGGIVKAIRERFFSFTMVVGVGFLLLVSLAISAVLSAVTTYFGNLLPGSDFVWQLANLLVSLLVVTVLFAFIFKLVPDAKVAWHDVWIGAAVTAVLFTMGKFLIGLYLGTSSVASGFGAAGTLVLLLVWVYYSAQILFLGAEFTQVYANRYGSKVHPEPDARPREQPPEQPGARDDPTRVRPSERRRTRNDRRAKR